MLQWWADYLDANRAKQIIPFDFARKKHIRKGNLQYKESLCKRAFFPFNPPVFTGFYSMKISITSSFINTITEYPWAEMVQI